MKEGKKHILYNKECWYKAVSAILAMLVFINSVSNMMWISAYDAIGSGEYLGTITNKATNSSTYGSDGMYSTTFYENMKTTYKNGYATEEKALAIKDAAELAAFAKFVNEGNDFSGKFVRLTNNIELDGTAPTINHASVNDGYDKCNITIEGTASKVWIPIGNDERKTFSGTFDGRLYEIRNMVVNQKNVGRRVAAGLFGFVESGTIKNVSITGEQSIIIGCGTDKEIVLSGGIAGINTSGNIIHCSNTGKVFSSCFPSNITYAAAAFSGGIVGSSTGSNAGITDCTNAGAVFSAAASPVYSSSYSGGIAGQSVGNISRCSNTEDVFSSSSNSSNSSSYSYSGGVVGYAGGSISYCSNSYSSDAGRAISSSSSYSYSGGIVGYASFCDIKICFVEYRSGYRVGAAGTSRYEGGVIGNKATGTTAQYCYYHITSTSYVRPFAIGQENGEGTNDPDNHVTGANLQSDSGSGLVGFTKEDWYFPNSGYPRLKKEPVVCVNTTQLTYGATPSWDTEKVLNITTADTSSWGPKFSFTKDGQKFIGSKFPVGDYNLIVTMEESGAYRAYEKSFPFKVTPKDISFTVSASKHYDGKVDVTPSIQLDGAISGDRVEVKKGTAKFNNAQIGPNKPLTLTGYELDGEDKANYNLVMPTNPTGSITEGFTAERGTHYTTPGLSDSGHYQNGFTIEAAEGYKVSTGNLDASAWGESITPQLNGNSVEFYVRRTENSTGKIWKNEISKKVTLNYNQDNQGPNCTISIDGEAPPQWSEELKEVAFELFYKLTGGGRTVTITAEDTGATKSGVKTIQYYVADKDLIEDATGDEATQKLEDAIGVATETEPDKGWQDYKDPFTLNETGKCVIYAKAEDNVGNVTYVSSKGLVLYKDAEQDTKSITYTKNAKADKTANVKLNENTIKGISISGGSFNTLTPVDAGNYTADDTTGTITLKGGYLETLTAGDYTLTVSYNSRGIEGSDEPADTEIALKVGKAEPQIALSANSVSKLIYGEELTLTATITGMLNPNGKTITFYSETQELGTGTITGTEELATATLTLDFGKDNYMGVGTYNLTAKSSEDNDNKEATGMIENYEVSYLDSPNKPYKLSGVLKNDICWIGEGEEAEVCAPDGYTLVDKNGKPFENTTYSSQEADTIKFHLKNEASGGITEEITVKEAIQQDNQGPNCTISIDGEAPPQWSEELKEVAFELFYRLTGEGRKITITATDAESGFKKTQYYVASEDLIGDVTGAEERKTKLKESIGDKWIEYKEEVKLNKTEKYVIYAKAEDNVGNVTYVSSEGFVLYEDAEQDTKSITYTKSTKADKAAKVKLNGNTIKGISISGGSFSTLTEVGAENYTTDDTGTITLKGSYLETLTAGDYTLTVSYNPQDLEFKENGVGDQPPIDTTINLTVEKGILKAEHFNFTSPEDLTYDGIKKVAKVTSTISELNDINVKYYKDGIETEPINIGTYVVKISTKGNGTYAGIQDFDGSWSFTILEKHGRDLGDIAIRKDYLYGESEPEITIKDGENTLIKGEDYDVEVDMTLIGEQEIKIKFKGNYTGELTEKINIEVDKSSWGDPRIINDITHYVDKNGVTSVEVSPKNTDAEGIIWLKEGADESGIWYGIDNSSKIFQNGSRFYIELISRSDEGKWNKYWSMIDENIKEPIEDEKVIIFLIGVTKPNGEKYVELNTQLPLYIQIGDNWSSEKVKAYFISDSSDEALDVNIVKKTPINENAEKVFAQLQIRKLSQYIVYNEKTENNLEIMRLENNDAQNNKGNSNDQASNNWVEVLRSNDLQNDLATNESTNDNFATEPEGNELPNSNDGKNSDAVDDYIGPILIASIGILLLSTVVGAIIFQRKVKINR